MNVNDDKGYLNERGAPATIASKLAPTEGLRVSERCNPSQTLVPPNNVFWLYKHS